MNTRGTWFLPDTGQRQQHAPFTADHSELRTERVDSSFGLQPCAHPKLVRVKFQPLLVFRATVAVARFDNSASRNTTGHEHRSALKDGIEAAPPFPPIYRPPRNSGDQCFARRQQVPVAPHANRSGPTVCRKVARVPSACAHLIVPGCVAGCERRCRSGVATLQNHCVSAGKNAIEKCTSRHAKDSHSVGGALKRLLYRATSCKSTLSNMGGSGGAVDLSHHGTNSSYEIVLSPSVSIAAMASCSSSLDMLWPNRSAS